jgi:FMNH2-dependent dimethyl sulfone monooxygenase
VRSSPEAYASYRDFVEGSHLESEVSLQEYSVSNRGLRANLIGTPEQITDRISAYEQAGVALMLLQFSPQHSEMERFGRDVIAPAKAAAASPGAPAS